MNFWHTWVWSVVLIGSAVAAALVLHALVYRLLRRIVNRTETTLDNAIVQRTRGPARLILPLLAVLFVLPSAPMREGLRDAITHLVGIGQIACMAWVIIAFVGVLEDGWRPWCVSERTNSGCVWRLARLPVMCNL